MAGNGSSSAARQPRGAPELYFSVNQSGAETAANPPNRVSTIDLTWWRAGEMAKPADAAWCYQGPCICTVVAVPR